MAYNWQFATTDAQVVKAFSKKFQIDAAADAFWPGLIQTIKGPDVETIAKAGLARNVVLHYQDLKGAENRGDTVTLYNAAQLNSAPFFGDVTVQGNAALIQTFTQNVSIDQVAQSVKSDGKLSEKRMLMEFRETGNTLLADWSNVFIDETFTIALVGESTFINSYVNYTSGGFSAIMNTSLNSTDSNHIVYAGNATTNATAANAGNVVTAQLLIKLKIQAKQKLSVPLRKLKGLPSGADFIYLDDENLALQLGFDSDWSTRQAQGNTRGADNPSITNSLGNFAGVECLTYERAFRPIANVAYGLFLGAGALHFVEAENWQWFEGFEDNNRKKVIMVSAMFGAAPAYFNSSKRNMLMVPHYVLL